MDHSITGTSVRAAGWLGSATLPAEIDGWKTPRCRVSASHPGAGPEYTVRFCRRPFSPQFFSPPLSVYLFYSLFLPWEHRRWSVITHHSTEEGFIMGLACWQDYCLDDKCSWLRALRGKLVAFFFLFPSTKTSSSLLTSAMLRGKPGTINTSGGWSRSLKAKWEFMKNKQITANVNQSRWSNYKHCGGIPRAVLGVELGRGGCLRFGVKAWSLMERTNEKIGFWGTGLIKRISLIRSEGCMMSPHHGLFCRGFCNHIQPKSTALAFLNTYKHSFPSPTPARVHFSLLG